jgi:hypothetical protein
MIEEEKKFGFKYISLGCVGGDNFTATYDQIMRRTINEMAHTSLFRTVDKYTWEADQKRVKN